MDKYESDMKVLDIINKTPWTLDCCGKQDLDFNLLQGSTRYYPDFTAAPSFTCSLHDCKGCEVDYIELLTSDDYIRGDSEDGCKLKVRNWYRENLLKALGILEAQVKEEMKDSKEGFKGEILAFPCKRGDIVYAVKWQCQDDRYYVEPVECVGFKVLGDKISVLSAVTEFPVYLCGTFVTEEEALKYMEGEK